MAPSESPPTSLSVSALLASTRMLPASPLLDPEEPEHAATITIPGAEKPKTYPAARGNKIIIAMKRIVRGSAGKQRVTPDRRRDRINERCGASSRRASGPTTRYPTETKKSNVGAADASIGAPCSDATFAPMVVAFRADRWGHGSRLRKQRGLSATLPG